MELKEAARYSVAALSASGFQKAHCAAQQTERLELIAENGCLSGVRASTQTLMRLTGIFDQKKGEVAISAVNPASLNEAAEDARRIANGAKPDPAHSIAEYQPPQEFSSGAESPDREVMRARLTDFLAYCAAAHPDVALHEARLDFTAARVIVQNSSGVDLSAFQGCYHFSSVFGAKDEHLGLARIRAGFSARHLDRELRECGAIDRLLLAAGTQTAAAPLPEKFVGEVIVTPDCLGALMAFLTDPLRDLPMISKTSCLKDALRTVIASPKFSLHARPVAEEIAEGYFLTQDGYVAQNSTIIGGGTLNGFLLSLYGSRKTQRPRALNDGGAFVVDAGGTPVESMLGSVRRGILVGQFSGGFSNLDGDFSGMASHCFYLENGEIRHPVRSVMMSGNLLEFMRNIRYISRERTDFGHAIFPYLQVKDVTLSAQ